MWKDFLNTTSLTAPEISELIIQTWTIFLTKCTGWFVAMVMVVAFASVISELAKMCKETCVEVWKHVTRADLWLAAGLFTLNRVLAAVDNK